MHCRRDRLPFSPRVAVLERRALLSGGVRSTIHPLAALQPTDQHQGFVNATNNRRSIAASVTHRVNEAFQAFAYHELNVPITLRGSVGPVSGIPVGTTPSPPTLAGGLALLNQQVAQALATREIDTTRVVTSVARGPKFTPQAADALIPFANQQIDGLAGQLGGSSASSLKALNAAYDAILDAVAENSVHPKLFRSPSDFYDNPGTAFTIKFDGDPVGASTGFYTHGPGGVLLRAGGK
jgi:hypothetical protein